MEPIKEQTPRQDLPDEGPVVPSEVQPTEGGGRTGPPEDHSMATSRSSKRENPSVLSQIKSVIASATRIVNTPEISELDYLAALKTEIHSTSYKGSDTDLRRFIAEAKAVRDGRKDFLIEGDELEDRDDEWLWQGVIMRQATNMVFAAPKVGKTRLMLAMLSHFLKGRGEFAGVPLFPGPEKLLLLGPDQSRRSWCSYMKKSGLMTDGNKIPSAIKGMVTAETGFSLDEYWMAKIEEKLRESGPLIVLLDSYSAAIRMRALDENKPEAAVPMQQLHNLVMAYDSTLIIIHHANKAGGDGNLTKASRGSSALPAAADNLIEMQAWKEQEEPGVKKYELSVSGRAQTDATPLIGYSKHSEEWTSYGSPSEAREELTKDSAYDTLSVHQLAVLDAVVCWFKTDGKPITTQQVVAQAVKEPKENSGISMLKTLRALATKGFVREEPNPPGSPPQRAKMWCPTPWAILKHQSPTC